MQSGVKRETVPFLVESPFEVMGKAVKALSPKDTYFLEEREAVIKKGRTTFLEVGKALLEIHDYKDGVLYKQSYGTFEQYCSERWEFGRSQAYRLMGAAETVRNLSPRGDIAAVTLPSGEKQIRSLSLLKRPADQCQAWKDVSTAAEGKEITSAMVSKAVRAMIQNGAPRRSPEKKAPARSQEPHKRQVEEDALTAIRRHLAIIRKAAEGSAAGPKIEKAVKEIEGLLKAQF